MEKPLVCFIAFNRMGVTAHNLQELLKTEDDFELIIVDNGSTDGTWEYVQSVNDSRIKEKKHFEYNYGVIYAINYGLSRRRKEQPYIHIESDMYIKDKHWIQKIQRTAELFPEIGLIAVMSENALKNGKEWANRTEEENQKLLDQRYKSKMQFVHETREGIQVYYNPVFTGGCNYLSPAVIEKIGYWNEEICGADMEIGRRICFYTPYYVAMVTDFFLYPYDVQKCETCQAKAFCKFAQTNQSNCINEYYRNSIHRDFLKLDLRAKIQNFFEEMAQGKRTAYSASIHDEESMQTHYYDKELAMKNFEFFNQYTQAGHKE